MEENKEKITFNMICKHYLSSVVIYGILLGIIITCPIYTDTIEEEGFNYTIFFTIYYMLYLVIAPIIFFIFKPKTLLQSKSIILLEYAKRQFKRARSTEEFLKDIEPTEPEKQAFMTFFIKAFLGTACMITLCTKYLPSLGYNFDFLKVMFFDAWANLSGTGIASGITQFILDTSDMWLKIIFTITTFVFAISYLTELDIFKNRIKSTDTTPLGILSCIACYYPILILTDKFIDVKQNAALPVGDGILLLVLNILVVLVNFISMIAILRLGTKAGNLTNRGIVTGFPYNIVRHPDYAMQILYIILTTIPIYMLPEEFMWKLYITLGTLAWIYIYYLRSITEERHLIKDENYQKYVEKVKYRFIPKLF